MKRCRITNNPCGTDTWMVGESCQCDECQAWLRDEAAPPEQHLHYPIRMRTLYLSPMVIGPV